MSFEEETENDIIDKEQLIYENIEDLNVFYKRYDELKISYKTSPYLNKYEKTKVLNERIQQLANNSKPLISNPENYNDIYQIAIQELKQKKYHLLLKDQLIIHMNIGN